MVRSLDLRLEQSRVRILAVALSGNNLRQLHILLTDIGDNMGGSVAEWLACWTQAQKGPGSNRSSDAVG